ncbi:MAG: hypothetical protein ACLRIS_10610 [Flavonifractor plautii]
MRLHRLRFDIWLCLLVAYLVSLGTGAAASASARPRMTAMQRFTPLLLARRAVLPGQRFPGTEHAELLELDTFTVLSQGIAYRNEGAGYFEGSYLYNLALPPGTGGCPHPY